MNVSFEDVELEKLIITHQSKKYKKYTRDKKFLWALDRVFNDLQGVAKCSDLKQLSYLHYEQLKKIGLSSVRVMNGRVERLLFKELGIPYDFWMRLQYGYEHDCLVIAQREVEAQQRTRREPYLLNKVASIL